MLLGFLATFLAVHLSAGSSVMPVITSLGSDTSLSALGRASSVHRMDQFVVDEEDDDEEEAQLDVTSAAQHMYAGNDDDDEDAELGWFGKKIAKGIKKGFKHVKKHGKKFGKHVKKHAKKKHSDASCLPLKLMAEDPPSAQRETRWSDPPRPRGPLDFTPHFSHSQHS